MRRVIGSAFVLLSLGLSAASVMAEPQLQRWYVERNAFGEDQPPKQLRVVAPTLAEQYPLVVFQVGSLQRLSLRLSSSLLLNADCRLHVVLALRGNRAMWQQTTLLL